MTHCNYILAVILLILLNNSCASTVPDFSEDIPEKEVHAVLQKADLAPSPSPSPAEAVVEAPDLTSFAGEVSEYRIGIPDELYITVWKEPGLTTKTSVRPDGKISFPLVGNVLVNGLTVEELNREITERLGEYIISPLVNVNVNQIKSRRVLVLGSVKNPTVIQLTHRLTILEAITQSGGLLTDELTGKEMADLDSAYISRNSRVLDIDFKRLIRESDMTQNIYLQKGDVINIPSSVSPGSEVYVFGEVGSPGAVSLKKGTRVFEAIARAGGFNKEDTANYIKVVRGNLKNPEVIDVSINKFYEGDSSQNLLLRHHDVVYVTATALTKYARFMNKIITGINVVDSLGSGIIRSNDAYKILKGIR